MPPYKTLYILYNADASLLGKLTYTYRKLRRSSSSSSHPACAACDITHGPHLSLRESPAWLAAKREIESEGGVKVLQLHRDEMGGALRAWAKETGLKYPAVVVGGREGEGGFREVMGRGELEGCRAEAGALVRALRERGVVGRGQASL